MAGGATDAFSPGVPSVPAVDGPVVGGPAGFSGISTVLPAPPQPGIDMTLKTNKAAVHKRELFFTSLTFVLWEVA